MEAVIQLLVFAMFGGITSAIAHSKGRTAVGFFFLGFFAPCIGLIVILCLDNLKERDARERKLRKQNRRLREEIQKDRAIADQRHAQAQARLSVHDRALGVDTSDANVEQLANEAAAGPAAASQPQTSANTTWHYAIEGNQRGPIGEPELAALVDAGAIDRDTLVWQSGMTDWLPIRDLPDLEDRLGV